MSFTLTVIFNLSILIAAVLAIFRFKKINRLYYPFIYVLWLACVNEILSTLLVLNGYSPAVNNNIYVGIEALLFTYFLVKTQLFKVGAHFFYFAAAGLIGLWIYENIFLHKLYSISSYFRIGTSFLLVPLSIMVINNLITSTRKKIFRNSIFLICTGFIIYFTFKVMIEVFWLYGLSQSSTFQALIYDVMNYINLFTNLIFTLAVLWMPRKQVFTMPL
jgi:hypothetical protein